MTVHALRGGGARRTGDDDVLPRNESPRARAASGVEPVFQEPLPRPPPVRPVLRAEVCRLDPALAELQPEGRQEDGPARLRRERVGPRLVRGDGALPGL